MNKNNKIYISYAWGEDQNNESDREYLVNKLYNSLIEDGFEVIRDKFDLSYKGSITQFMEKIGAGDRIILILSDKYFKSEYCLFELYEVGRNSRFSKDEFVERIFPVFVEFINFADPDILNTYYDYWEEKERKWKELIDKRGDKLSIEQFARYDKIKLIHQNIGKLMDWIVDLNTLNPKLLSENNFEIIKKALQGDVKINSNSNQTTGNMNTKDELLELVAEGKFKEVFEILDTHKQDMSTSQRTVYSRLKGEFEFKGNHDMDYVQRVQIFIGGLDLKKK